MIDTKIERCKENIKKYQQITEGRGKITKTEKQIGRKEERKLFRHRRKKGKLCYFSFVEL
jgi:hypothetical protein